MCMLITENANDGALCVLDIPLVQLLRRQPPRSSWLASH